MDLKRTIGPLKTAPDAVVIEGTALTADEIVERIISLCHTVTRSNPPSFLEAAE